MKVQHGTTPSREAIHSAIPSACWTNRAARVWDGLNVTEAAKHLGIPRPTVHRLLTTLEELGFVRRGAHSRFLVDIRARRVSDGYDTDVRLSLSANHAWLW